MHDDVQQVDVNARTSNCAWVALQNKDTGSQQ